MFPTPSGKCELYSERMKADGLDPLPTYTPPLEDPADSSRSGRAVSRSSCSARRGPSSSTRRSPTRPPPHRRRRADHRAVGRGRRSRGLDDGQWAEVYNDRGRFQARVALTGQRPARRGRRHRHLLEQALAGRLQRQQHDVLGALTDMGGGATFFDNLVEVRAVIVACLPNDSISLETHMTSLLTRLWRRPRGPST